MRRIGIGFVLALIMVLVFRYCEVKKEERQTVTENSQLIQEQLKNVGKLIVTEGHYAKVYTYKDQKEVFGEYLYFEKKALVVVNAYVTVSYDLHQLKYEIDEENKTLHITGIPEAELKVHPTLTFYDVNDSYFNPFTGEDYNTIRKKITEQLQSKLETSPLTKNARNRLLSELSKLYILTRSLGWTITLDAPGYPELNKLKENDKSLPAD